MHGSCKDSAPPPPGPVLMLGFPSGSAVKNLPEVQEMWETQVLSLAWEDLLEEGMATHSSILAGKNPMDRGA